MLIKYEEMFIIIKKYKLNQHFFDLAYWQIINSLKPHVSESGETDTFMHCLY